MGVDATAAAKEATEAGCETSTLLSREALRHPSPPGLPGTHLSRGHCGPGHFAAGSISGLRDGPCGRRRGEECRGPGGCGTKRYGCEERGRRDSQMEAGGRPCGGGRGGKKEGRRGAGGNRGRKQCSRRGPGRVPLPNAATKVRFGNVAPAAGGHPGRLIGGRGGSPRSTPRRLRWSQAGWGGRDGWPGHGRDGGAAGQSRYSDPTPARPPSRVRGGAVAGGQR